MKINHLNTLYRAILIIVIKTTLTMYVYNI